MKEIIKRIEEKYNININKFLELYELKYSRKKIAEQLGLTIWEVRQITALLGLRMKKRYRTTDLDILLRRLESEDDLVVKLSKDLEVANEKLLNYYKSLTKCRDENNLLRKQFRLQARTESIIEKISDEITNNLNNFKLPEFKITKNNINFKNGLNLIVLSDLHIGAKVDTKEVGGLNNFNYEIALTRINTVINECLNSPYKSENLKIIILGDIFDGMIHNSYLIAEFPVTEAVVKFSHYIIYTLLSLATIYENVSLEIISGNHDRLTEKPTIIHKNFDFAHLFYEIVKLGISSNNRIKINYGFKGYYQFDLPNNKKGFAFHGDTLRKYSPCKESEVLKAITLCKQIYNVEPNLILSGHLHQYSKTLLPNGGYAITIGSLLGTNQYSYTNGWLNSIPSQLLLFYNEYGELEKEKVVILSSTDF